MKMDTDKNLEKFADKVMNETSLENPSPGFTSKVMTEILAAKLNNATVYKPLISKRGWFMILGSIIVLIIYVTMYGNVQQARWFQNPDFRVVSNDIFKNLSAIKFSSITIYTVVLLTVMLFVQFTILKNYFNKRIKE